MPNSTDEAVDALAGIFQTQIGGMTLEKLLSTIILLLVGLIAIKIILSLVDRSFEHLPLDASLKSFLRSGLRILLLFVLLVIILGFLNVPVTSLIAVLSVVGLALSLAIQNLLSNVAGGLQLLSTKPFVQGDFIDAGGVSGTVSETGMFYTKLLTVDNKLVQVPNSQIAGEKIVNYSSEENRRVDLKVSASYDAPIEAVKAAIRQVVGEHPLTLATPEPLVRVNSYGDSAIEYVVRVWCANADYWTVHFDVLEGIKHAFDRAGIEMTYNHLNVHMLRGDQERDS